MRNLLHFEFRKLRQNFGFYLCTGIMLALQLLSALLTYTLAGGFFGEDVTGFSDGFSGILTAGAAGNLNTALCVFIALFVCLDYTQKTIKTVYAKGYSRENVFFSKLIMTWVGATVMYLVVALCAFVAYSAFFGVGEVEAGKFLAVFGVQYVSIMANVAMFYAITILLRSIGAAIPIGIFAPSVISLILNLVDAFGELKIKLSDYWVGNFSMELYSVDVKSDRLWEILLTSLVYIVLLIGGASLLQRKQEA